MSAQLYAVFWVSIVLTELFFSRKRKWTNYELKESYSSFIVHFIYQYSKVLTTAIFAPFFMWFWQHRLFNFSFSPTIAIVVYLPLSEFIYYWAHRISHHYSIDWASHIVHHSFTKMNTLSGSRQGLTSPITLHYFLAIPFALIGFHPLILFFYMKINLFYQMIIHTDLIPKIRFLDSFLNTPSNHRVHHGTQDIYLNKNFGGITIIFDKIFGTYQPELDAEKPIYGIKNGLPSQNPFYISFCGWIRLLTLYWNSLRVKLSKKLVDEPIKP